MESAAEKIKILILGTGSVGKTALACRFTRDLFLDRQFGREIAEESLAKITTIDGMHFNYEIFHYIRPEDWAIREGLLMFCDAIIVMYSIIAKSSFFDVADLHNLILRTRRIEGLPIILAGNKIDLREEFDDQSTVKTEEAKNLADRLNMGFYEISAKTNQNVNDLFYDLTRQVMAVRSAKAKGKKDAKKNRGNGCKMN
jgi:small GTP-binding protein